ncbi:hypothetical protein OIU78_015794 [Salix suchowensis]|nr:hypothetical protein OIU78_015794 [Salix suchowensis]
MADQEEEQDNTGDQNHKPKDPPQVLVLKPPPVLSVIGEESFLSNKYQFLKAWESPLPLHRVSYKDMLSGLSKPFSARCLLQPRMIYSSCFPQCVLSSPPALALITLIWRHATVVGFHVTNAGNVFFDDGADAADGVC